MKKVIAIILACSLSACLFVGCNSSANSTQDEATETDKTISETVEETTEEEVTMQFMTTCDPYYMDYDYTQEPTAPINEQTFYDNSTEFIVTEQYASNEKMISEDGYSIMGGDRDVETLVLPSEYNGKKIVSVYDYAYATSSYDETTIKNLVIPDTIECIGLSSFMSADELEKITFGKNLKKIDSSAFSYCSSIKFLEFNENLKSIMGDAFLACNNLTKVKFNGNINLIGASSFSSCSLETIEFKGEYDDLVIGNRAFANNPNLKKVYLPEGTVEIGAEAFMECENLEELHIPASVTRFEYVEKSTDYYGMEEQYYKNDILKYTNATIYAPKGSAAEQYAKITGREFVAE